MKHSTIHEWPPTVVDHTPITFAFNEDRDAKYAYLHGWGLAFRIPVESLPNLRAALDEVISSREEITS
jgi:hypothetical protein